MTAAAALREDGRDAILVAVALGFVIFGVYSCCEARKRNVRPG